MLITLAMLLVLVAVGFAISLGWLLGAERATDTQDSKRRVTAETLAAEWRIQQLSAAAFAQMLDEARRSQ